MSDVLIALFFFIWTAIWAGASGIILFVEQVRRNIWPLLLITIWFATIPAQAGLSVGLFFESLLLIGTVILSALISPIIFVKLYSRKTPA